MPTPFSTECTFTSSFLERGLERERERVSGGERVLCATMLLGQANVVRHCALAKACFALAFDSQVQCRECPLNVGPPASSCCCCCCCTASPSDVYIYYLPMTRVLTLELFWGKKGILWTDTVVDFFKTIYCSGAKYDDKNSVGLQ